MNKNEDNQQGFIETNINVTTNNVTTAVPSGSTETGASAMAVFDYRAEIMKMGAIGRTILSSLVVMLFFAITPVLIKFVEEEILITEFEKPYILKFGKKKHWSPNKVSLGILKVIIFP